MKAQPHDYDSSEMHPLAAEGPVKQRLLQLKESIQDAAAQEDAAPENAVQEK